MPSINLTVDLVRGAIIAIIGLLAMQELSRIIRGILSFFKPPVVAPRTLKSPFQQLLDFVKNVALPFVEVPVRNQTGVGLCEQHGAQAKRRQRHKYSPYHRSSSFVPYLP